MEEQNKTQGQPSTDPNQQPLPSSAAAGQNPATGYPPAKGYPPTTGYPLHGGYPPNPNGLYVHQQQQYRQAPPQMYYQHPRYQRRGCSNFAGGVISIMMLMILFLCLAGVFWFLVERPRFPGFRVDSFQVSDFNVETDNFTSTWSANITIENNYWRARVRFDRMQSFIYLNRDDLLASSILESAARPITIDGNDKGTLQTNVSTNDYHRAAPPPEKKAIDEMRNERKTGSINFSMEMFALSQVESGLFNSRTRYVQIGIACTDLKVDFDGGSGHGKMNGGSKDCDVYIL